MKTDKIKKLARYLLVSFLLFFQYFAAMPQSGWAALHGSCAAISYTGGQIFYRQFKQGLALSEGVEQAYLLADTIIDDGCAFQPYDNFGIQYGDTLDAGEYELRQYFHNANLNYDRILLHHLTVHPQTMTTDTMLVFTDELENFTVGLRHDTLTSETGCDSIVELMVCAVECANDYTDTAAYGVENVSVHLSSPQILPADVPVQIVHNAPDNFTVGASCRVTWLMVVGHDTLRCEQDVAVHFPPCGGDFVAVDGDGNVYTTTRIGADCWMKENLKATHYANGVDPIAVAESFTSGLYTDTADNVANYGRLYSWYSAMNVPEDSSILPVSGPEGFIQGICPAGWHIPSLDEIGHLATLPVASLRKEGGYWFGPANNLSGYSAVPGGKMSSTYHTGEHFQTIAHFWSAEANPYSATAASIHTFCDDFTLDHFSKADACSIRCLKD